MIRRSPRPSDSFTVIRNDVLRDSRLSFRARGLLASILSRPDNWTARVTQLVNEGKEGREAIRSALDELKDHGYLRISQYRNEKGQFVTDQVVYDVPQTDVGKPVTGNPSPDNRDTDSWEVLEEPSRTTEKKNREERTRKNSPATQVADDGFSEFWKVYPRRIGKKDAHKMWVRAIRETDAQVILDGARRFAESVATTEPRYIAHPSSWLNGERWTDEPDPEFTAKPTTVRGEQIDRVLQAKQRVAEQNARKELEA